ncbi:MAG: hypothetical protein BGO57_09160 [Sphingomonadales bacterium 63-6]|nr:MAG: hypothetical protein BGO57_09160 [Sphingomonadales bacterium 63-6]
MGEGVIAEGVGAGTVGVGLTSNAGEGLAVGVGAALGVAVGRGEGLAAGRAAAVGVGVGAARVGVGRGLGVGRTLGAGAGLGVGVAVAVERGGASPGATGPCGEEVLPGGSSKSPTVAVAGLVGVSPSAMGAITMAMPLPERKGSFMRRIFGSGAILMTLIGMRIVGCRLQAQGALNSG